METEDRQIQRDMQHSEERRKHLRFSLRVPAICTWERPDGVFAKTEGTTRDISANGAYIVCDALPPPNTTVQIELRISQFPDAPTISMTGKMQAQRVEPMDGIGGFAVAGKSFVSRQFSRSLPVIVSRKKNQGPTPIELHKPYEGIKAKRRDLKISSNPGVLSFKSI